MQEENTTNTKKIIVVSSVLLLILILVPVTFYLYISTKSDLNQQQTNSESDNNGDKKILSVSNEELRNVISLSSKENIDKNLDLIDKNIDSIQDKNYKDLLLLRKAFLLNLNRDSNKESNTREATKILVDIINSNYGDKSATSTFIKDYATIGLVRFHDDCCFGTKEDDYLFDMNINGYENKYYKYKEMGYDAPLSKFLTLNDLSKTVSPGLKNDVANVRNILDIEGRTLRVYGRKISPEIRKDLVNNIKEILDSKSKYQAYTIKDPISVSVELPAIYAYAFDVYNQEIGNKNLSTNKQIDLNYESINSVQKSGSLTDEIGLNTIKYFSNNRYLYSMNLRYGKNVDTKKLSSIVDDNLKLINSHIETKSQAYNNLHSNEVKTGEYVETIYFISLRSINKNLDDYLKSIGI